MDDKKPMVVADPLAVFEKEAMLKVIAPAKTNLFLAVGDMREDGYHEVTTVLHALTLHDILKIDYIPMSSGGLEIEIETHQREGLSPFNLASEDNSVVKAIRILAAKLGRKADEAFSIRLEKHIPQQAGLGGGSSDAAAALVAAASIWNIDKNDPRVLEAAREVGSDVAFFLYGGSALFAGRGEVFQRRLRPMNAPIALIKPDEGASTAAVYRAFNESPIPVPEEMLALLNAAKDACQVPLYNNLEKAAEQVLPELEEIYAWASTQKRANEILLSGSGSTLLMLCDTFDEACSLVSKAQKKGWLARSSSFSQLSASIIPK